MLRDILIVALVPSVRTAFSPAITIGKIVRSFIMPALAIWSATAAGADHIFVQTGVYNGGVGEYTLAGGTVNAAVVSGLDTPRGIAVSGQNLFVVDHNDGLIGEYTLSGGTVDDALIGVNDQVGGVYAPQALAVSGSNLFVTGYGGSGTVGEYTTNGATVDRTLITGVAGPYAIAVSGTDLYVGHGYGYSCAVSKYTTSGQPVNASLITAPDMTPGGIAVSGSNIFVSTGDSAVAGVIMEYTTDGQLVNDSLVTGLIDPLGIAISGDDLFVLNQAQSYPNPWQISEYTTSGQLVNPALVSGLDSPQFMVIAPGVPNPPPAPPHRRCPRPAGVRTETMAEAPVFASPGDRFWRLLNTRWSSNVALLAKREGPTACHPTAAFSPPFWLWAVTTKWHGERLQTERKPRLEAAAIGY